MNNVESWLSSCRGTTLRMYRRFFQLFEHYMNKSGDDMLKEARVFATSEDHFNFYPSKIAEFAQSLLNEEKFSQNTVKVARTAVQSFFAFHALPMPLKKFINKDSRLKNPQVAVHRRLLTPVELAKLINAGSLKEKAIIAIGASGQDASTTVSLHLEQFHHKLSGEDIQFIDLVRPKSNLPIRMLLTRNCQKILGDFILSLKRESGFLFAHSITDANIPLSAQQINDVFKDLCSKVGISENGKRLSFHCLRKWFSTQLQTARVNPDYIAIFMGHQPSYGGAYSGVEDETKLREVLTEARAEDFLRLIPSNNNGLSKELELQKTKLAEQAEMIQRLVKDYEDIQKEWLELKLKHEPPEDDKTPVVKITRYQRKPMPKTETEILHEELESLKLEIAELKKQKMQS